jgi:hypothetical protein
MFETVDSELMRRLKAASYALPVVEMFRDLADEVACWSVEGVSDKEIDKLIVAWLDEHECGFDAWMVAMEQDGIAALAPGLDLHRLWGVYGVEQWAVECVRSLAFTDEPTAFLPFTAGFMIDYPDDELPMLIAIMTPLTDLDLAGRQIKERGRAFFGDRAAKPNRRDEVEAAKMLHQKRAGMSYRDIAIENLRSTFPDIIRHPTRHRERIATEKDRVAKRIKAAQKTWNERLSESSTP